MKANPIPSLEVFLNSMHVSFLGDIEKFKQICDDIEEKEGYKISTTVVSGPPDEGFNVCDEKYYRLTIPIALSLFAVADVLGYLISNSNSYRETTKNLVAFFNKRPMIGLGENSIAEFINIVRNGIVHSYYPKYIMGIQHHTFEPRDTLFVKNEDGCIALNVKYLIDYVDTVFQDIIEESKTNANIVSQYNVIMTDYYKVYNSFINKLGL